MNHTDYMASFVPFNKVEYKEIVTEMQDVISDSFDTKALTTVKSLCKKGQGLVLLTGNAGHGKTFIAREILLDFYSKDRSSAEDVKSVIADLNSEKLKDPGVKHGGKKIAIHLDLSHIGSDACTYLEKAFLEAEKRVTVVCVNEGRLRSLLSNWKGDQDIREKLNDGLQSCLTQGIASKDNQLYFINLNFQSVVAGGQDSILEKALSSWIDDDKKWNNLNCSLGKEKCPICWNRELLKISDNESNDAGPKRRREGITFLLRLAELYGHPTTVREMLQLIAYSITGGKTCSQYAHEAASYSSDGWQSKYSFHRLIFGPDLNEDDSSQLPLVKKMKFFDPANGAWRLADDQYVVLKDDCRAGVDLKFIKTNESVEDARVTMRGETKADTGSESAEEDSDDILIAISILRRRDFFDLWKIKDSYDAERANRLNINDYVNFSNGLISVTDHKDILLGKIIKGLNVIQGVFPWSTKEKRNSGRELVLLHPAFIRLESHFKALNCLIKKQKADLDNKPQVWTQENDQFLYVQDTADYLPTHLYFSLKDKDQKIHELSLSLERYTYLAKAAEGCFSKNFYSADIARIRSYLASLSFGFNKLDKPDELTVVHDSDDSVFDLYDDGISC